MRRLSGQAARGLWGVARRVLALCLGLLLVGAAGFGVLAWWLTDPVDMPWLAARIELADPAHRLHVGHAALAWAGFARGHGAPVDIRLTDVTFDGEADQFTAAAPVVAVTLNSINLLRGRLRARSLSVTDPVVTLDLSPSSMETSWRDKLREAVREVGSIRQIRFRNARVAVNGMPLSASLNGELTSAAGLELRTEGVLSVAGQPTRASFAASAAKAGKMVARARIRLAAPGRYRGDLARREGFRERLRCTARGRGDA